MSISVKNISVSIAGTKSSEFDIELEGVVYYLDDFTLFQRLQSANVLTFSMHKGPEEDIDETLFSICGYIIGKEIELSLLTEIVSVDEPEDKVAEIRFKGVILSAAGSRSRSEYSIRVEAMSWEALLNDNPNCKSFESKTLDDIVGDVTGDYAPCLETAIEARFTDPIPYCVQYNETNYLFLQRLARRYGEWLYSDGERLVFGKLPQGETVKLAYPGQDIPSYDVDLRMRHVAFSHVASSYNASDADCREGAEEMCREYNGLSEKVFQASEDRFSKPTLQNLHSGGFADTDGRETLLNVSSKTQARGEKASMLTYSGNTFCSKLKIGGTLVIEDNYITNDDTNEKGAVEQDEILIIELTHCFSKDRVYSNHFVGIPAACDYPPYTDSDVYPASASCRAKVTDNEDPNNLGRVRVQFDWQAQLDPQMKTPWLRIAQPYAGKGKGFSFIPEIGEEVMIDFEGGNAERPYVKGSLYNGVGFPDEAWLADTNSDNRIKAIRTRNGHTVEIHDEGQDGYIRIYDHEKENYILTFSTDEKLIKLESTGNIELYAGNDIVIHADNDILMTASHDMRRTAENDICERAGHDRTTAVGRNDSLSVGDNQFVDIGDNKDERIAHKLQTTAENMRLEARDKLLEYSTVHHQKASDKMAINAANRIDIKAVQVKTN